MALKVTGLDLTVRAHQAWISPFVLTWYGYTLGAASTSSPKISALIGGFVGAALGCVVWVLYMGLSDLAETVWSNQKALALVNERLEKMSKAATAEEEEEAVQLAALVSKVNEIKSLIEGA